jgi:hypothetical protein
MSDAFAGRLVFSGNAVEGNRTRDRHGPANPILPMKQRQAIRSQSHVSCERARGSDVLRQDRPEFLLRF